MIIDDADVYVTNAAAMLSGIAREARDHGDHVRAELPAVTRILLRRPAPIGPLLDGVPGPVTIEDVFGPEEPAPSATVLRLPTMVRPAGPPAQAPPPGVVQVRDEDGLAVAERVMIDGFPFPRYQPVVRGHALPPRLLGLPGWRFWLAYSDGEPAAAAYTFDDGAAVGLYWLATLAEFRSRGLGRAILNRAFEVYPEQPFTLTATEAGLPLYESLGFRTVAIATWYTRS
ncbi:GNAT family N-acetyltransferase [Actinoplanes cyaneus]|uniref:GNAT family N-acetyltransferase n=1 Tax=Actinoplanes cyaneus TaxID=52696 RepID=UPI0019429524|nr:GNAT family N-acetyltransferase [Actinoplanes cyaneus]